MRARIIILCALVAFLGGCAAMPYKDEFSCPQQEKGICDSVENVHEMAISKGNPLWSEAQTSQQEDDKKSAPEKAVNDNKVRRSPTAGSVVDEYRQKALESQQPDEDVAVTEPILMRVHFAKYKTKAGTVVGEHHIYRLISPQEIVAPEFDVNDEPDIGTVW